MGGPVSPVSGPMRVLLDTHTLIWALTSPDRLGERAIAAISDRDNELVVSAASAWELSTKARLGKLPAASALLSAYGRQVARLGATELSMSSEHALLAGGLAWDHRDPFDRMLAAQAFIESTPLVTRDPAFETMDGLRLIW